ncbi:hypothetical protein [uncultured Acinetobacter sp.]|uniref:hypothetical protein n=1 Tax=uncultured Acinetobacter sp. TaxID=165433 RepID=UPI00258D4186|nr:hypothetical protein [uncultured Acinetobacter sp.]
MDKFKEWFVSQYFYTNMRFVHGDALFDKDGDFFRILAVQIAWEAWQSRQTEINQLQSQINEMAEVGLSQGSELNKKDEHAHNLYYENANLQTLVEEKDKRIETVLNLLEYPTAEWSETVFLAIKALRGEYE